MSETFARRGYLHVLRRGWLVVVIFVVLGGAVGWGITLTSTKVFRASVQLFVAAKAATSGVSLLPCCNTFAQDRVQSYPSIANSPAVTNSVVRRLHLRRLGITSQRLATKISADAPQDEPLVNIHVTDHDPARAVKLANAVAWRFSTVVERTEEPANGKPLVKLTVIHPAAIPASPIRTDEALNIGLGFLIGLLVGVGVVIARDR